MYTQFINELNIAHSINLVETDSNVFFESIGGVSMTIDFNNPIPEIIVDIASVVTYDTQMRQMDSDVTSGKRVRSELYKWINTKT